MMNLAFQHGPRCRTILPLLLVFALPGCGDGSGAGGPVAITPGPGPTATPSPIPTATPGLNFAAAADFAIASGARAVVAIQDGAIQFARYANGGAADRGETLASGTKSFTCTLASAAQADGLLGLDDLAAAVVRPWRAGGDAPQLAWKQQIRLRDLLSIHSGLAASGVAGGALNSVDSYAQALYADSRAAPDTGASYNPNHFQAAMAVFELRTGGAFDGIGVVRGGRDPLDYLQTRVLDRIGVRPTDWSRDRNGKPNFGGGAPMTARDWARYGAFVAQHGRWNGTQIVPADLMRRCLDYRPGGFQGNALGWWVNRPVGASYNP